VNDAWGDTVTSRRTLLGAGLTGLLAWPLTGCDDSAGPSSGPSASTIDSPDRPLVVTAVDTLQGLLARASYTRRHLTRAEVRSFRLEDWIALHRAQRRRLGPTHTTSTIGVLRSPTPWAAMRAQETSAAHGFAASALKADAGALAGLLAQLAAGIDMQLAATAAAPVSLDVEPEIPNATPTIQVDAMQRTLADEHAALYLYGVLGAHTSASRTPALFAAVDAAYVAHRARRDRLTALLEDAGEEPAVSEPGYRIPAPLRTDRQIAAEGLRLERSAAAQYLWLVENSTDDVRAFGVAALRNTAVRELSFRGSPEIFPGAV
jgi:hypothetical protein